MDLNQVRGTLRFIFVTTYPLQQSHARPSQKKKKISNSTLPHLVGDTLRIPGTQIIKT